MKIEAGTIIIADVDISWAKAYGKASGVAMALKYDVKSMRQEVDKIAHGHTDYKEILKLLDVIDKGLDDITKAKEEPK